MFHLIKKLIFVFHTIFNFDFITQIIYSVIHRWLSSLFILFLFSYISFQGKKQLSVNIEHQLKSKLTWTVCPKSMKLKKIEHKQWLQLKKLVFLGYNLKTVVRRGELTFSAGRGIKIWWGVGYWWGIFLGGVEKWANFRVVSPL